MMEDAAAFLREQRRASFARAVTYWRGLDSVAIDYATRGETRTELDTGDGVLMAGRVVDWLIDAADLVIDGETIEPRQGDYIVDGTGTVPVEFVVVAIGTEPAARWHDRDGVTWRIHSIQRGLTA